MVKVIGEAPEVFKQTVCRHCAAKLEYTPGDVKARHGKDYSGGSDGAEYVECPRCGSEVILKAW